jgi:DNA-binding response OmpR family regulator
MEGMEQRNAGKARIVVIEANALMRELLDEWLRSEGYEVEVAAAPANTAPAGPDLVIVDLQSPRDEGPKIISAVKRQYPDVPILAMSGAFSPQIRAEGSTATALGARRVIAKPFLRRDMLEAVRALIGPPR